MGSHASCSHTQAAPCDDSTAVVLDCIRRIVQTLRVSARAAEERVGISGAQLYVLTQLAAADEPLGVNDLAARTLTHQSSVSVVVSKLERRGLVRRARSSRDGRQVELSPTPAAAALLRRAPQAAQEQLVAALAKMPPRRRTALATLLGDLIAHVEGAGGAAGAAPIFFL
jgi:MarR family transcriptional regulator, lower aerobic nicotinate degradation pathway regulator